MSWLLAWLILNAIIFVWRLLVVLPGMKAERSLRKASVTAAIERA